MFLVSKANAITFTSVMLAGLAVTSEVSHAQVATSTLSLTCSSSKKLQATINSATSGVATTISVSGTCNENIVIPAGKTIILKAATTTAKITAASASLPALISFGDTTIQGMTISNSSGTAEALVETERGGTLQVISGDLSAPNVDSIVGAWRGTTIIVNSRVIGGKYNAFDTFGSSTLTLKGDPSFQAGPTGRFETYVKSANTGLRCNQGGSVRLKAIKSGSAVGFVTMEQSQYGISAERCELEILNDTGTASNIQVRNNSVEGIYLQQSHASIDSAVISNNSNNGVFLEDSSIHLNRTTISNSGACGLNIQRGSARLGLSTITNSGTVQDWATGVCSSGGPVDVVGGMLFSNNAAGDIMTGYGGTIVFRAWNDQSSLPDFASGHSLGCWSGGHIYVESGSVIQDLAAHYSGDSCISFD